MYSENYSTICVARMFSSDAFRLLQSLLDADGIGTVLGVVLKDKIVYFALMLLAQRFYLVAQAKSQIFGASKCTYRSLYYRSLTLYYSLFADVDEIRKELLFIETEYLGGKIKFPFFPTCKGLIFGSAQIYTNYAIIEIIQHRDGLLITEELARFANFQSRCNAIVIVEKDTVFQIFKSYLPSSTLLITGKGYSDRNTIEIIKRIVAGIPSVKLLYFGDLDPHGLAIYLDYVHRLRLPVVWCGLNSADVIRGGSKLIGVPMTCEDLKLMPGLSRKLGSALQQELTYISERRKKYELECMLASGIDELVCWLLKRLVEKTQS
jgi:Uncharacterized protein conserved in bacteria C-term(DUF2220)